MIQIDDVTLFLVAFISIYWVGYESHVHVRPTGRETPTLEK